MRLRKRFRSIWRNRALFPFLLPSLSGVALFVLIPFADVVRRSFVTAVSGEGCGLRNYVLVVQNQAFLLAAKNTLRFLGVCLPILLFGSLCIAVALQHNPASEVCKTLYLLPMAMPVATVVLVWRLAFARQGLLSGLLGFPHSFLEGKSAFWVLVLTYVWKNLGYTVVLWLAALKTVPPEIKEAARVDGAGAVRVFFYVTLPWLKGAIYTISLLSLLNAFKVFREVYLIGGAYPDEQIYMLQHLFHNWYVKLSLDKMAAGAVMAAFVPGLLGFGMARFLDDERDRSAAVEKGMRKLVKRQKDIDEK